MFDSDQQTNATKTAEQLVFPRKKPAYLTSLQQLNKIQKLSEGAFGKVYQYYNPMKNQFYAVKQMIIQTKKGSNLKEIKRQIELLYTIDSPYLIKLLDHFVKENQIYLIMEFVDGNNLYDSFLKPKKQLQNKVLCQMIQDICQGLQYLHQNKIVHRDIKLQNIMVSSKGQIKIIDLGESDFYGEGIVRKTTRGTKTYFAPQITNRDLQDDRIDVWCLGVIIYELYCMQSPFRGANEEQLFQNIRRFRYSKEKLKKDQLLLDLFSKIFTWHVQRISIQQLKNHPWIKKNLQSDFEHRFEDYCDQKSLEQYKSLLKSEIQQYKLKIKQKKQQNEQIQKRIQQNKKKKIKYGIKQV